MLCLFLFFFSFSCSSFLSLKAIKHFKIANMKLLWMLSIYLFSNWPIPFTKITYTHTHAHTYINTSDVFFFRTLKVIVIFIFTWTLVELSQPHRKASCAIMFLHHTTLLRFCIEWCWARWIKSVCLLFYFYFFRFYVECVIFVMS